MGRGRERGERRKEGKGREKKEGREGEYQIKTLDHMVQISTWSLRRLKEEDSPGLMSISTVRQKLGLETKIVQCTYLESEKVEG